MHCAACGGKTHPELHLRLERGQSARRALACEARYCWTCGTSTPVAPLAGGPPLRAATVRARLSALAWRMVPGASATPTPDRHWLPQGAPWPGRAGLA